ncbi:hypothetical protein GCM10007390_22660 [Persicitalea jodogahamensis]|uniref:TonB C-terminal domain-containing protein n=2 Tax=Persicitalea jodogahamensis TaxID=402147 RepID=A0A8J3GA89_9BACT|nr:hypothetical protein GCM10007390_22660 [Persicitalea jodogahamensis]
MKIPTHLRQTSFTRVCHSAQLLLDYALGDPFDALTNKFLNSSTLKNRIAMLYKNRNSKWALGKYLAVVAFVGSVALLMAFKPTVKNETFAQTTQMIKVQGIVVNSYKMPLPDVLVKTSKRRNVFVTDLLGQYEMMVPAGSQLQFSGQKYKPIVVDLNDEDRIVNIVLAASDATDSSVANVYPIIKEETVDPDRRGFGQLIPKFMPDTKPRSDSALTLKYHFLSDNSQPPAFPGGSDGLREFIARNVTYPARASRANVQGKALLSFVVSENGEVQNVEVLKSPGFGLKEESLQLLASMPTWVPGQQNGKKVEMPYQLILDYRLATDSRKAGTLEARAYLYGEAASYAVVRFYQPIRQRPHSVMVYFKGFGDKYGLDNALYVLDGKPVGNQEAMGKIPADHIASVNIVRGAAAQKLYGEKGANGVVAIVTKKAAKKM